MGYKLSALDSGSIPRLLEHVETFEQWEGKVASIHQVWHSYIGPLPKTVPVDYTIHAEHRESDHVRLHLSYGTAHGDRVTAYLLIPGHQGLSEAGTDRYPAVLALHPTAAPGKDDVALATGRENRRYGYELVKRGYIVLAPDTITAGERVYPGYEAFRTAPFYEAHPEHTAVGKMIHDHQSGIDLLESLACVDPGRIGAIGHSLGAYNAFFLSAVDSRIQAVVSSCGFCPMAGDPDPNRWGERDWFSHLPKLTKDIAADRVPFEFHEILALTAPRPVFNWFGQKDHIFPNWEAAAAASLDLSQLYEWLGFKDRYIGLLGTEGHDFPQEIREMAYRFLDRHLLNDQPVSEPSE